MTSPRLPDIFGLFILLPIVLWEIGTVVFLIGSTIWEFKHPIPKMLWKPEVSWKWLKWTMGFWRDYKSNTCLGIDIGPLEIIWRYESR